MPREVFNHRWNETELKILKLQVDQGIPFRKIAETLGMSKSCVSVKARRMGWKFKGRVNLGNYNANWSGDDVGYGGIHKWVRRYRPAPKCCEICGVKRKRLDCANISGEYKRDLNDWIYICRKCHMKTDGRIVRWNFKRIVDMQNGINLPKVQMKFERICIVCGKRFKSVSDKKETCGINCYKKIWRKIRREG